jgi:uncharacterized membrane protein
MPNLHPFVVHFPIALLMLGLIAELWASLRKDGRAESAGLWLQVGGTIGVMASVATGILAGQGEEIANGARSVFDTHQQGAFISAAVFAGLLLWRAGGKVSPGSSQRVLFLLLYAAGVAAVVFTGLFGGRLVFEFGIGVATGLPK